VTTEVLTHVSQHLSRFVARIKADRSKTTEYPEYPYPPAQSINRDERFDEESKHGDEAQSVTPSRKDDEEEDLGVSELHLNGSRVRLTGEYTERAGNAL
jgi:hypothetical protein